MTIPRGEALVDWLASLPAPERDGALEGLLGLPGAPDRSPGDELVGHHASGVGAIARLALALPLGPADRLVDLGSGLGKVALTAHLLTGVRAHGIEIQPELVETARARAAALGVSSAVTFELGDAREAPFDGTVFYAYLPFTGVALASVLARLERIAEGRAIVVATLGLDLARCPWLAARDDDDFWLTIYESRAPGISPRPASPPSPWLARLVNPPPFPILEE